jgi:hypothetical protein
VGRSPGSAADAVGPGVWTACPRGARRSNACRELILGRSLNVRNFDEGGEAVSTQETGQVTGTKDKDYNIIWFVEQCLNNVLRLETYVQDAERDGDNELADFFRRAQGESRKGAEQGKEMLRSRLAG